MRDEYDFTHAKRGQFYQPNAQLHLPVYIDDDLMTYLKARAKAKNIEVNQLVNELLRKDIELIEVAK